MQLSTCTDANSTGVHLWHRIQSRAWLMWREFTPDSELCLAGIKSVDPVPIARGGLE